MRPKTISILLAVFILAFPQFAKEKNKGQDRLGFQTHENYKVLNARYKDWLNMVAHIASGEEKNVFMKLPTARDRDMYIDLFWRMRDPSPGTTENEYKEEILRRFKHVNKFYSRGTPKPGWKTDMGMMYMILGEPNSIETFDNESSMFPAQVWYYYGDPGLGLPTYFNVMFFRRHGVGEWVLYDPVADGPESLIVTGDDIDTSDYIALYRLIKKIAPSLAGPAISMIPGEMPVGYRPTTRNSLIMSNIFRSPTRKVNVSYASNFLKYKGFVQVDSSTNFTENAHVVSVTRNPRFKCNFIQFSIKPKKLSIDYSDERGKYFFHFNLAATLKDKDTDTTVYEYTKTFEQYVDENDLEIIKAGGVVLHGSFPSIPGRYQLLVFIQNQGTKGFSYFEKNVNVPAVVSPNVPGLKPYLASPVLGFAAKAQRDNFFQPFKFGNQRLLVDADNTFGTMEPLYLLLGVYNLDERSWQKGTVEWIVTSTDQRTPFAKNGVMELSAYTYRESINRIFRLPLAEPGTPVRSGYYEIVLKLTGPDGQVLDMKRSDFTVSPTTAVSRPTELYSRLLTDSSFYFDYIRGIQYRNIGDLQKAEFLLERSVLAKPGFYDGLMALLAAQLQLKKFDSVLKRVDLLKSEKKAAFQYHRIRADAFYGLGNFEEALKDYLEANKIFNRDVGLINRLGMTFVKLGEKEQAIKAFEASLQIDGNQPLVRKNLESLKK